MRRTAVLGERYTAAASHRNGNGEAGGSGCLVFQPRQSADCFTEISLFLRREGWT